ncbi:MAG: tetratricopeptide repeat protein [Candidatus Cloacimonetes bacterium]|nr:tetratricopeptide repeat protein [Candidatus Cloacimonadota bacterium]MBL7086115.1 tetratricopeptide repeat protein [Candidatus Cloacimonadota bacterium]
MQSKITYIILFIGLFFSLNFSLYSYQNEDFIKFKLKTANNYEKYKKFTKAEQLYKELLTQFPHNFQVIQRLSNLYLSQKEFDKLELLLDNESEYINDEFSALTQIEMYLKMNKFKDAENTANNLINKNKKDYNIYKRVALVYMRNAHFDKAIEMYKSAREISKNPILFANEMASIYKFQMNFQEAIEEYLNMLDKKSYKFIKYSLEKLDVNNEEIIRAIKQRLKKSKTNLMSSLLGEFLLINKDYENAFRIYKNIGNDALLQFADICAKKGLMFLCIQSYKEFLNINPQTQLKINIYNKMGDIYYQMQEYNEAYKYYQNVIKLYNRTYKGKLPISEVINAYYSLAKIELFYHNAPDKAREFILQAQNLPQSISDMGKFSILLADSYLYESNYDKAVSIYKDILSNSRFDDDIHSLVNYKLYLTFIFQKQYNKSDSLFQNFIAHNYESIYLNDIVSINKFFHHINILSYSNELINGFMSFLKALETLNTKDVELNYNRILGACQDSTCITFLQNKIADYYFETFQYDKSLKKYLQLSENVNNEILNEYVQKRIGDCYFKLKKYDLANEQYRNYLINYPTGAFAPEVRIVRKEIEM